MTDLESITPRDALDLYVQDIAGDLSPNSVQAKEYQLGFFIRWCEGAENGSEARVEDLNEITGRDFTRFKNWRSDGISKVTLRTNMSAIRSFMRFCVSIDAVDHSIPEKINVPQLDVGENHREDHVDAETAETILEYLDKFEYASFEHALFRLQWMTGMRMSGIHSIDVDDFDEADGTVDVNHRPEQGTRLKNNKDGERLVNLDALTTQVLADFIEYKRYDTTDDYGRCPLFTSEYGRMDKMNLNKRVYRLTAPCWHGQPCPSDRKPEDCEHTGAIQRMVECPHNSRPHAIRGGSITYWLRDDVPKEAVSDRVNAAVKTLDRHYDERSKEERAEQRRDFFAEDS